VSVGGKKLYFILLLLLLTYKGVRDPSMFDPGHQRPGCVIIIG